ncbi:DUF3100 domain-containing protein [Sporosalibacterium faouarense]|uniref:DUF3100 domain-containing protein n=1 Tax=Sporosalibacterium faouarense TaxID=516123 RepID=UPI00141D1972|nr:DUF3100 domain-containing protein [Sporosalibacterium faouarense]MTI48926.1 DUF3100 domain-containing protein [Bacillota bacterium]
MTFIKSVVRKYWKVYVVAVVISIILDSIGTLSFNIGLGTLTILPMVFATIVGGLLGPDTLKLFDLKESKLGGSLVLVALAPFMAKMGVSAGANLSKLVEVGPALILQEFGNLATIVISLPLALLLGLKRESIGACYSINRDSNLGLTTDIYGPDAPETKGTFAVYIVGSVIGTIFMSLFVNIVASWGIFHPLALGMASGIGSGSMMSAGAGTLGTIYPEFSDQILVLGGASDMLTGITGIYIGTFIALPITTKLYKILEPKLEHFRKKKGVA